MNKFFVAVFAAVIGFAMASSDAEARRLGGGSSFGMQRSIAPRTPSSAPSAPAAVPGKPAPAQQAQAPAPAAPQPSGASRWLGPLAGIAAGVGLAALLSHFGIGEGLGSILIMAALVFGAIFLFRMLFARRQPAPQYAGAGAPARFEPVNMPAGGAAPGNAAEAATGNVPAGFDVAGFVRNAKLNFVRLQTANDAGNVADLKEFTTPEVFAELKMQIDERRGATQQTDVVQLDAELLGVETEAARHVASVRFHGLLREDADAAPASFDEIWHLTKPVDGTTGWVVAGIQQVQ